jgi:hypothetical protein
VKWLAKLALLAVLPMKCFVFLNSQSLLFFFFPSEVLVYFLTVIMGNYWLIRL